jgi:hypothetical protein
MYRRSKIRKTVQRVGNFLIGDWNSRKPYTSMCTKMRIYTVCRRKNLRRQYADCVVGIKIHGQWEAYSIWVEWDNRFFDRWRDWGENHLGTKTPMRVARYDLHKFPHRTSFKEGKVGTFRSPQLQYPEDIAL